ncbi:MAG: aromatic amino acid transport family protein [Chlamydiales bacterium]
MKERNFKLEEKNPFGDASGTTLGGAFLIAGTTIGAGMLALPIATGSAGFVPGTLVVIACWFALMLTGLLFVESTLHLPDGANVLSITKYFLGRPGEIVAGITYLFLYYCLMVAYISGGTLIFQQFLAPYFEADYPLASTLFCGLFALLVFLGSHVVDRTNLILMAGLIFAYLLLLGGGVPAIHIEHFMHSNWKTAIFAAPILFSAFGFHNIIPTLSTYLHRNPKRLRNAVMIGTILPLMIFLLWQWLIIGLIPYEKLPLLQKQGIPIGELLSSVTNNSWIAVFGNFFAFFAIITSLLGVSLSMVDFIGDGIGWTRLGWHRLILVILVFLPPGLIAAGEPSHFLIALGIAGGLGEAIINGIIPIVLVWRARYHYGLKSYRQVSGGRTALVLLTLFIFSIMIIEGIILVNAYVIS